MLHFRAFCGIRRARRLLLALTFGLPILSSQAALADPADPDEASKKKDSGGLTTQNLRPGDALDTSKALYATTKDPWDACAAGRTAFRLGKMPDAVEYLSLCDRLRESLDMQTLPEAQQKYFKEVYEELTLARERCARLALYVRPQGAEILVDGKKVGSAPLGREIWLEPGRHRVRATFGNRSLEKEYNLKANQPWHGMLLLDELEKPEAQAPPLRKPQSAPPRVTKAWTWPEYMVVAAGGVAVTGAAVMTGAYVAHRNALADMAGPYAYVRRRGCKTFSEDCQTYWDAVGRSVTAETVLTGTAIATATLVSIFLSAYMVGDSVSPIVEITPTEGGVGVRGTF